jgi:hypothetical protein
VYRAFSFCLVDSGLRSEGTRCLRREGPRSGPVAGTCPACQKFRSPAPAAEAGRCQRPEQVFEQVFDWVWDAGVVAGGMRRGQGLPMRERVALRGSTAQPPPGRHCWVAGGCGVGDVGEKRPGLLVEWRRGPQGWEGRVVYVSLAAPGRWVVCEEWIPAERLVPA